MLLSGCTLFTYKESIITTPQLLTIKRKFVPSIIWSVNIGGNIGDFYSNLHPAYINHTIYAADYKGTVKAINSNNGKEIWVMNLAKHNHWPLSAPLTCISAGITTSKNHIYLGSTQAQVFALNAINGAIVWQTQVAGEVLSCPIVTNGLILIYTSNNQLQALNETNGVIQWTVNLNIVDNNIPVLSLRNKSSPVVVDNIVIIGSNHGLISALSIREGKIIWQQHISQQITGPAEIDHLSDINVTPVILNNIVYAVAYNGNLTALDIISGQIIWEYQLHDAVSNLIFDGKCIYISDINDSILAININDGVTVWTQNHLLHHLLSTPILYNNNLIVGDSKGYIYWLDIINGSLIAQQKITNSSCTIKPVIADNKLLIQTTDGTLYAVTT